MKILIANKYGNGQIEESLIIPRVGDTLDMFYTPLPIVVKVILFPTMKTLEQLGCSSSVAAIVLVD